MSLIDMDENSNEFSLTAYQWKEFTQNMNDVFLILISIMVFFMQAGFAFYEMGTVRSKNTTNILMKNVLDSSISSIIYWACGYAFAFGSESNSFIGFKNFFLYDLDPSKGSHYFFHFVFAATAATIVSGSMAERTKFGAYFIYSLALSGFVYPIATHWAWAPNGWLVTCCWWDHVAYRDFAGSGVLHMLGGAAALMGTLALGPRLEQFNDGNRKRVKGHTVPMTVLGAFILFMGFFAFNGGAYGRVSEPGDGAIIAHILNVTILGGSAGGLTIVFIHYMINKKFTLLGCINGILTGMVATCAGCDSIPAWTALITGILGGLAFVACSELLFKWGVDDPLDAFAVHYGGGVVGIVTVCFFNKYTGIIYFYDSHSFKVLIWNMIGGIAITVWTVITTGPLFYGLKFWGLLRVSEATEREGLDFKEHGEVAYPEQTAFKMEVILNERDTHEKCTV